MIKKIILLFVLINHLPYMNAQTTYEYRIADIHDLNLMIDFLEKIDSDELAKKCLVTYPVQNNFRIHTIARALNNNRLFIALEKKDSEKKQIIALLKMFIVDDPEEADSIIFNELNATPEATPTVYKTYSIAYNNNSSLEQCDSHEIKKTFTSNEEQQTYVYYGGAVTLAGMRGKGHNFLLQQAAFNHLTTAIIESLKIKKSLVILFGQVAANINQKGIIVSTAQFISSLYKNKDNFLIEHIGYEACKPELIFNKITQQIDIEFPDENKGIGSILIHTIATEL